MCPSSLLLAVAATLVAVVLAHGARRWLAFRALARALGGQGVGGERYVCRYSGRGKSRPARLTVTIDAPPGPAFRVSRPTTGTTVLLALGLGRAVRTGVPALDDGYVVACDVAEWSGFAMREDVEPGIVAAAPVPPELVTLAEATRRHRALATVPTVVLLVGCGLLAWVSIAFRLLDQRAVLFHSLWLSLPWLALFLAVGTQAFRLSTTSARDLGRIVIPALIGFPLTGYATEVALNCGLDAAPAAVHRAVVVDRTTTSSRNGAALYWAIVHSWRGPRAEYIPVSPAIYEQLVPNRSELAVVTRPGRLGFEWIVDKRLGAEPGVGSWGGSRASWCAGGTPVPPARRRYA